ncbi:hypothetical protein AB0P07_22900 [Streptomyces sp. NPDC085944]
MASMARARFTGAVLVDGRVGQATAEHGRLRVVSASTSPPTAASPAST